MTSIAAPKPFARSSVAAMLATVSTVVSGFALLALHVVSPEYQPSWHMVSEYANGRHGWLLTVMFVTWAAGYWALAAAVWPISVSRLGRLGLLFLLLAGVGEMMGGLFDVNHQLHGAAFAIGVPSLTIAAILVTVALRRAGVSVAWWPAHVSWISVVVMATTLWLFVGALQRAGIEVGPQAPPLRELPPTVSAWHGWANRLVIGASYLWLLSTARTIVTSNRRQPLSGVESDYALRTG